MKIKIGDMEFEDNHKTFSGGSDTARSMANSNELSRLQQRLEMFLEVAERLYNFKMPQRTTFEEF